MMGKNSIMGKTMEHWASEFPLLEKMRDYKPVFWMNNRLETTEKALYLLTVKREEMMEAEKRLKRFAPLIQKLFPETEQRGGIIESELKSIENMGKLIRKVYNRNFEGKLFLKCDNLLPVAGSIKARGGIYEVLKHAEDLALNQGLLKLQENYAVMGEPYFRDFFSQFSLAVGSTGNLGLSIGIMGAALGFKVTVHMSADAKQWKKNLLLSRGVRVVEYASDYSKAVEEGRRLSLKDPKSYFVDDEHSKDLFLGYSVAAIRLEKQLSDMSITVDESHPMFVYLPCGVGGAPGGICFGLKQIFGDNVHVFFVEPTHSPCMLLGMMTGAHNGVSVQDFGIDNVTDADGLAVGRASGFVGKMMESLVSGIYTVEDNQMYRLLAMLKDSEAIKIEPSATPGLLGPVRLMDCPDVEAYLEKRQLADKMDNALHIAWATGGVFVPEDRMEAFYMKGKSIGR